jgi:hypothetical protein
MPLRSAATLHGNQSCGRCYESSASLRRPARAAPHAAVRVCARAGRAGRATRRRDRRSAPAIQSDAIVIGPGVRIPTAPGLAMPTMSSKVGSEGFERGSRSSPG